MFLGISVLEHTHKEISTYCQSLGQISVPVITPRTTERSIKKPSYDAIGFIYIPYPKQASFAEAKARCIANNMQLPEIYTMDDHEALSAILYMYKLTYCFAGLEPDMPDATFRFINTGYPIFRTPHNDLYRTNGSTIEIARAMDDFHAKFM